MKKNLLSIIIPTYKRLNLLMETIESINKQTYNNIEIIVIDDDPNSNNEKELYNIPNVIYKKNTKNLNAGMSRNVGYNLSDGEYIIFCDDDDIYTDKNFFNDAVEIFNKNSNVDIILANSDIWCVKENIIIDTNLNCVGTISGKEYLKNFQMKYNKPNSTFPTIFRKEVLDKADFENMKMMNDTPIYLRALTYSNDVYIYEKKVGKYRVHSVNISYNLASDFIIENLNEKIKTYNNNSYLEQKWIDNQIFITVSYFFNGSNPNKDEKNNIYAWIKENSNNYRNIIKKIKFYNFKHCLKKLIKGEKNV